MFNVYTIKGGSVKNINISRLSNNEKKKSYVGLTSRKTAEGPANTAGLASTKLKLYTGRYILRDQ